MDLQSTLQEYALQLKNTPLTLLAVAGVVQKIMKTLYDAHFPNAEDADPGGIRSVPTATSSRSHGNPWNTSVPTANIPGISV